MNIEVRKNALRSVFLYSGLRFYDAKSFKYKFIEFKFKKVLTKYFESDILNIDSTNKYSMN